MITNEFVKDVITTAIEGGINYWANTLAYKPSAGRATIQDLDSDLVYEVRPEDVKATMQSIVNYWMPTEVPQHLIDLIKAGDAGNIDADDADMIIQLTVFTEIIYG